MLAGGLASPAAAGAAATGDAPLVLITGSLIQPGTGAHGGAAVVPAGRGLGASLLTLRLGGRTYAIPSAALPYLGRGLAPSLFDLGLLHSAESGGRLPVQVTFTGTAPALPGITITQTGPGSAQGYLTATSAKAFGAALAHQFATDHARGDYGSAGLFAGGVSIGLAGAAQSPPAATPGLVLHTLTVKGTNLSNKPDTGDIAFVFNVDNPVLFGDLIGSINFFFRGETKFSVPAGHYWAIGDFFTASASGAFSERLVVLPQFTVGANTSVTLRATRASSKVAAVTPRPSSPLQTSFELVRSSPQGSTGGQWLLQTTPLWVSPTRHRPTVGTLRTYTYQQRLSPRRAAGRPYEYDVAFQARGVIPPQRHVVTGAHLATVSAAYYQAVHSRGAFARFGLFPAELNDFLFVYVNPLRLPRRQTEYYSAAPRLAWQSVFWQSYQTFAGGQLGAWQEFRARQRLAGNWNAYPLHPGPNVRLPAPAAFSVLPSASRQGDTLTLDITPFTDNQPGHLGAGFFSPPAVSGSYEIDENGVKIAGGDAVAASGGAPDLLTSVNLAHRRPVIRFALDATRTGRGYPLSTSSHTVWTWRSVRDAAAHVPPGWLCGSAVTTGSPSRNCVVQPMMTVRYHVAGLSLAGRTAPGRQSLELAVGHLQLGGRSRVTHAGVQVSFDDGSTWRPASVTRLGSGRYRAVFTAPGSSYVTLRVAAHDAAGGQIRETILRAYQTKA